MSITELREYQSECLREILGHYRAGVRRQLVCLPTGTGKTVIFAHFPSFLKIRKRMLVLAHRGELLEQAREKILSVNPSLKVDIEQAGRSADPDCNVVVASVPTLGRVNSKRLARLDPEQFYVVVIDEAHHAPAETYGRIVKYMGLDREDSPKLLVGFTATPKRGDGEGLDKVFDQIIFSRTLPEMIRAGYLSPVTAYRIETDIDLSGVRTRMGDFVSSQLSSAVNVDGRNQLVVKVYDDILKGRKSLVFCVDVAHARQLARAFVQRGVAADAITGDTPPQQRADTLARFSEGALQVLTNCMVLTEGYDEPGVEGILLARPTKSSLLYTQMIGRGTRLHPGKENVTVVDIVDNSRKHALITLPSLFGLSPGFDLKGRTTTEIQDAMRWVESNRPWVRTDDAADIDDLRYKCRHIDLMQLDLPDELCGRAEFAWTQVRKEVYRLGIGKAEAMTVSPNILGKWDCVLSSREGIEKHVGRTGDLYDAVRYSEDFLANNRPDSLPLVALGARWRHLPATEKQIQRIRKAGLTVPRTITRGQASHLIAMVGK